MHICSLCWLVSWTPWQIHHAVQAYTSCYRLALQDQITAQGTDAQRQNSNTNMQSPHLQLGTTPVHGMAQQNGMAPHASHLVHTPLLLPGVRCYTDASTTPDSSSTMATNAGLGILIINNQRHPTQNIYIKALFSGSTSVLMAEAAAQFAGCPFSIRQ